MALADGRDNVVGKFARGEQFGMLNEIDARGQ